jgi:DNA-binding transcriptional regulator YiaG
MSFEFEHFKPPQRAQLHIGESVADHRARLAREQEEIQQRRSEALAGQVSVVNAPAERIRIWEQLHGLALPRNPAHKLLRVIAVATELQLEQVREVQRLRLSAARGKGAEAAPTPAVPEP